VARTGGTRYGVTDFAAEALPTVVSASAKSYEAAAWVKAASPSAVGKPVTIALHERAASGRTVRVTTSPVAVLTRSWRQVWVTGRVVTAGDTLGIRVQQREAAAGNAMAVDDLRMHPYGAVVGIGTAQTERTVDPNVKRATAVDMTPCSPNDPLWINCDAEYDLTSYDAYVDGRAGGAGSATLRGVIYADGGTGPSTLVAATRTVVVKSGQAARWVRLPLSEPVELGSRVYWFGYQVGGSSRVVRFYGDDASYCDCGYTSVGVWNADGFDNGPSDRFGPSHGANFNTMVRGAGGR
jgi:hypothetical protein